MLNQQHVQKLRSVSHLRKYKGYMVRFKIIIINYAKNNGNYVLFPAHRSSVSQYFEVMIFINLNLKCKIIQ